MEQRKTIQVVVPPLSQTQGWPQSQSQQYIPEKTRNRFTVEEALQFTPLTTSVLPAHDRIPIPQITRARESARLSSSNERKVMQQTLSQFPVTKVKERLRVLLDPEMLSEITFRHAPTIHKKQNAASDLQLSSTAKMIFDMVDIGYQHKEKTQPVFMPAQPTFPSPATSHGIKSDSEQTPPKGTLFKGISIQIPQPPANFNRDEYATIQDPNKVRRLSHDEPAVMSLHVRSQKEAADASLLSFQNSLMEIFEAQDQLDAGSKDAMETGFFESSTEGDDPTLSTRTFELLQISMKKLVGLERLTDISSDHLRQLQRLCEPSIDRAQTINLRHPSDSSPEDQEQWHQRLIQAMSGIASSAVCLYTILGCPHDENLLGTDALSWIPNVLVNVFENCLIPVVEARPEEGGGLYGFAVACKDSLKRLLEHGKKLLDVMSTVCSEIKGAEGSVNAIEFLAAKLIFVQNSAADKFSCLGIQAYEKVRKTAMSSLAKIYAQFPNERRAILDEVLSSLDKLPSGSRGARQYRLGNGINIQLISALFMQLVQNTSLELPGRRMKSNSNLDDKVNLEDSDEDDTMQVEREDVVSSLPLIKLREKAAKLFDSGSRSAKDIVSYLVGRASKTTKSGDSPYRTVLDMFVEDLVRVLPLPDWPSSELLLRILAAQMIHLAQNDKTASTKNMALESLGVMGSAISTIKASLPGAAAILSREGNNSKLHERLLMIVEDYNQGRVQYQDLISINGPFAAVSRSLWSSADQSLRTRSACGYYLAQYAKMVSLAYKNTDVDEQDIESEPVQIANFLLDLIPHIGSGDTGSRNVDSLSSYEADLAYTLTILNLGFCRYFGQLVKTISSSFQSDQALVRTRSLKSVLSMLETDSTLLDHDHTIADDVFRCAADESANVRDSALSIIAKFIIAKPSLEQKGIKRLLECASDPKVGVQKRALGHLKDIYAKDTRPLLKAVIASTFLKRTADHEDVVADLARKILTEVWITPTLAVLSQSADTAKSNVAVEELTMEIVNCILQNPLELSPLLRRFFGAILKVKGEKDTDKRQVRRLCARVVDVLFDKTISTPGAKGPLTTLTAFAEADAQLVQPSRLDRLQSYLGSLRTEDDLFMFRSVISILRCVLPDLSATHNTLLQSTQMALLKACGSLGRRTELDVAFACLSTIDTVLKNTTILVNFVASVLKRLKESRDNPKAATRLLRITGAFSRYLDLEGHNELIASLMGEKKIPLVANYVADTIHPLTKNDKPHDIRLLALEGLGSLCQANPAQLNKKHIQAAFYEVFQKRDAATKEQEQLLSVVLRTFEELYAERAQSKEASDGTTEDSKGKQELGRMGGDSKTRAGDSAIVTITRDLVVHVLDVAMSTQGENALLATKTLFSISHQGLIHPKQSTGAFVALGTSPDCTIAEIAHTAHRLLHQTHESVCEREYMSAVRDAFVYQRDVVGESGGARLPGFKAKLADCFQIVNSSSSKYVKKFLSGLVSQVKCETLMQESNDVELDQVHWTQFLMHNLAFFEYGKLDDLLHTILQLELAYSKSGGEISRVIEAALPPPIVSEIQPENDTGLLSSRESDEDMAVLIRMAPAAAILTMLIETRSYLKKQFGIGRDVRTAINNSKQAKDTNKVPTRVHGITGERLWSKMNTILDLLNDQKGMRSCCQGFVALMNVDDDVEVEDEALPREDSASIALTDTNGFVRAGTPGARKRKGSASIGNTPAKRRAGRTRKESSSRPSLSASDAEDADGSEY